MNNAVRVVCCTLFAFSLVPTDVRAEIRNIEFTAEASVVPVEITTIDVGDRFTFMISVEDSATDTNASVGAGTFSGLLGAFSVTAAPANSGSWAPSGTADLVGANTVTNAFGDNFTFEVPGSGYPDGGAGYPFGGFDVSFQWPPGVTDSGTGDTFAQQLGDPLAIPPAEPIVILFSFSDGEEDFIEVEFIALPPPGIISGTKFEDLNGNGMRDEGEPGVPGIEVCTGDDTCVLTDDFGNYEFSLPSGDYLVCEQDVTAIGWVQSFPNNDLCDEIQTASPAGYNISLESGELNEGNDFGNFVTGSAHPFKFDDANRNGAYDFQTESGLAGIEFELTGITGMGDPVGPIAEVSDQDGYVWFIDLPPGAYEINELVPPDYLASTPTSWQFMLQSRQELVPFDGAAQLPSGSPRFEFVVGTDLMFGNFLNVATVLGVKYEDSNANGSVDDGEFGRSGINIQLLQWADSAWVVIDGALLTSDDGAFQFNDLIPGEQYAVCEVLPSQDGWTQSFPSDQTIPPGDVSILDCSGIDASYAPLGYEFTPDPGQEITGIDFLNYMTGSIHPVKFEDLDSDGSFDPGEPPVAGIEFELAGVTGMGDPVGPVLAASDANGRVAFEDLTPGEYTVTEIVPDGWINTVPAGGVDLVVSSGQEYVAEDGGAFLPNGSLKFETNVGDTLRWGNFRKLSVTACKMVDQDGKRWTDDLAPQPGWTVYLVANGFNLDEQVTGPDGCYTWEDLERLEDGTYAISEDTPPGWTAWTPTSHDCGPMSSGDDCEFTFINAQPVPVPTLSNWALAVMALMLAGIAWRRQRHAAQF